MGRNVAFENRDRLIEMIGTWYVEAGKYNVMPIDGSGLARMIGEKPLIALPRDSYTLLDVDRPTVRTRMKVPMNSTVSWRPSLEPAISRDSRRAGSVDLFVCEVRSTSIKSAPVGGRSGRADTAPPDRGNPDGEDWS